MSDSSPILGLPYIQPSQAQKHVSHNEALRALDVIVQLCVLAFDAVTPPGAPAEGAVYGLGAGASDAWAGQAEGTLAGYLDGLWHFVTPRQGWLAGTADGTAWVFSASGWTAVSPQTQMLEGVGIGTTSDATNRLSVVAGATLLSHAGTGHQLKINKASAGDTCSLLFQSNWSGRAEMGLAGTSNFAIKVSPDGSSFTTALSFDAASGIATGAAVQQSKVDATAGRLMPVGAFGVGANDLTPSVTDGKAALPSGFYGGAGSAADIATFPNSDARDWPILNMTRRIGTGQYATARVFFDATGTPHIRQSGDEGATWPIANTLFGTANLLGPVSQVGGTPSGAVIEHGSNANGDYVRFADGTQICTIGPVTVGAINVASGAIFESAEVTVTFPAAFAVSSPRVASAQSESSRIWAGTGVAGASSVTVRLMSAVSQGSAQSAYLTVTGRWF